MDKHVFDELYAQQGPRWTVAKSKLWYSSTEQAEQFLKLQQTDSYQERIVKPEQELLREHAHELDCDTIVDLGCGDGTQAKTLIEALKRKIAYFPVDTNEQFLKLAKANMTGIDTTPILADFAQQTLDLPSPKLLLLLGNTFTNFDEQELLKRLKSTMSAKDKLLIGVTKSEKIVNERLPQRDEPSTWSLRMLDAIGLSPKDVEEEETVIDNRYLWEFGLLRDKRITQNSREIIFRKEDRITNIRSAHYTTEQLKDIIEKEMTVEQLWHNEQFMLCLCR